MAKVDYDICLVNGQKALFHRWVDVEKLIIKFDKPVMDDISRRIVKKYNELGVLPHHVFTNKITNTYGLVEFEDGHIEKVEPTSIRFIDHVKIFEEYCWPEEVTE